MSILGEDPFVVLDVYNNKVYADGQEITTSKVVAPYSSLVNITAFCLPSKTHLIAVTNALFSFGPTLIGFIEGKLMTNEEWRCVKATSDAEWYQVNYNDTKWPPALAFERTDVIPNIPQSALEILPNATRMLHNNYFCRVWIVASNSAVQEHLTSK